MLSLEISCAEARFSMKNFALSIVLNVSEVQHLSKLFILLLRMSLEGKKIWSVSSTNEELTFEVLKLTEPFTKTLSEKGLNG